MTIVCKRGNSETEAVVFTSPDVVKAVVFSNTYGNAPNVVIMDCGSCNDVTITNITTLGCNVNMPITMEETVKLFIYENN